MASIKPKNSHASIFGKFSGLRRVAAAARRYILDSGEQYSGLEEQSEVTEIVLTEEDARAFDASFDEPPSLTPGAIKAAEAYRRLVKRAE
ncbi:MAG: hypothetical protein V6Z81_04390 [Parvularculales bacterium]